MTGILVLSLLAVVVGVVAHKIPPVHAAGCTETFCPNGGGYDTALLSVTSGGRPVSGNIVHGGEYLDIDFKYNVDHAYGGNAYTWLNLDSTADQITGTPHPWLERWANDSSGNPTTDHGNDTNPCPHFWYAKQSNYYNKSAEDDAGHTPGTSYDGAGTADGLGYSTCGDIGYSVVWSNHGINARQYSFHARVQVNPSTTDVAHFCIRADVSLDTSAAQYLSNVKIRSNQVCLNVQQALIRGAVKVNSTSSTGQSIDNFNVYLSYDKNDCTRKDLTDNTHTDGGYLFTITQKQPYCVFVPGQWQYTSDSPSTNFNVETGQNASSGCTVSECDYDFIYDPVFRTPGVFKCSTTDGSVCDPTAGGGNGDALKPGQTVDFYVAVVNDQDANQPGPVTLTDNVPLNLESYQLVGTQISLLPNNVESSGLPWQICGNGINGTPTMIIYGYSFTRPCDAPTGRTSATAFEIGGANSPHHIGFTFENTLGLGSSSRMPAYSKVVQHWRGVVRSAASVGVYPGYPTSTMNSGDLRYCVSAGANYDDANSILSHCQDKAGGYQGVANFATVGINNGPTTPSNTSNTTYNPIPGDIPCIGKSAVTPSSTSGGSSSFCGVSYENQYLYSADPAQTGFNSAWFNAQPNIDVTAGPVEYYVYDQGLGAGGATPAALAPPIGDPDTFTPATNPTPSYSGRIVRWGSASNVIRWPDYTNNSFGFHSSFVGQNPGDPGYLPIGGSFTNQAAVCYIPYWNTPAQGHGTICRQSNPVTFTHANINEPYVTSAQGGVHTGGNIDAGIQGTCAAQNPLNTQLRDAPHDASANARGWYVVSTMDTTIAGINSIAGYNLTGYSTVCRPDLEQTAHNLISKNPVKYQGPALSSLSGNDNALNGHDGTIVDVAGDFHLGSAGAKTVISHRWTLVVSGNLYVDGDICYSDDADQSTTNICQGSKGQSLTSTGSLGLVVHGGIFIDKNVKKLAGDYYAKQIINTCSNGTKNLTYRVLDTVYNAGGYSVADCSNQLTVDGMLMANGFRFNRTSNPVISSQFAENAILSNKLYLATPPAFSDLALLYNPATYGGERRPRY